MTSPNKIYENLSDVNKKLYDAVINNVGTSLDLKICRSVAVIDAPYDFYNVQPDQRVEHLPPQNIKCVISFPLGQPKTREDLIVLLESLIPVKAYFSSLSGVKEKDVLLYPFDKKTIYFEVIQAKAYGVFDSILTETIIALSRDVLQFIN